MTRRSCLASALLVAVMVEPAAAQQLAVTEVRIDSIGALTELARAGFEVASVRRVAGVDYALVVTTASQRDDLGVRGFALQLEPATPAQPPRVFRSPSRIDSLLTSLAVTRDNVFLDTIGLSYERRPIVAVKIGTPTDAPSRPNALFIATHHAREWISTEVALGLVQWLADSLAVSAGGQALLDDRDIWVIPVLNPDGYAHSFAAERLWRKNRRPNADGSVGVDLNRNYPAFWGHDDIGSSGTPGAETFRGTGPASEPEVAALMDFHALHPPDVAISYHSFTDLVLYPYGYRSGALSPDATVFRALAGNALAPSIVDRLPEAARPFYHAGPAWQLYPTNGEYTEWAYRAHGTIAFTVELTSGCCVAGAGYGFEFPDDSAAVARVFADNLPFALALLDAAGDPESARGPGGGMVGGPAVETLWPVLRIVGPPGPATLPVARRVASNETIVGAEVDSLDRGRARWRWQAADEDMPLGGEIEVPAFGLRVSLMVRVGAEDSLSGWSGWRRDSTLAFEGRFAWLGERDTLTSPEMDLSAVTGLHLAFWTRHGGSLFLPGRRGRVEFSADAGTSWRTVEQIEGAGGDWYPVTVSLPETAPRVRVRFIAENMSWLVDGVHVFGTLPQVRPVAAVGAVSVSENPVRSDRIFLSWSPVAGQATVSIMTFTGELVFREAVPAQDGQVPWDLTNRSGAPVSDGAYVVVVELPSDVLRRRLFVARRR